MKNFIRNEKGSIFVTFAIVLSVLIVIVLAAVNLTQSTGTEAKFAQTADSALLAAVAGTSGDDAEKTKIAREFFIANMPESDGFKINSLQVTSSGENTWKLEVSAIVDNGTFGEGTISHDAEVKWEGTKTSEIVLVANTSGSMCTHDISKSGSDVYKFEKVDNCSAKGTDSKFNAMKNGFIHVLEDGVEVVNLRAAKDANGNPLFGYRVGVVPFNHKVKFPAANHLVKLPMAREGSFKEGVPLDEQYDVVAKQTESFMYRDGWTSALTPANIPSALTLPTLFTANEYALGKSSNYYTTFDDAAPLPMVYPLVDIANTQNKNNLIAYIDKMYQDYQGLGWNRTNIGLLTAALMLDPNYNKNFGGVKPEPFDSKTTEKIIVLMTDGANTGCCFASYPGETFKSQFLYEYVVDNVHMIGVDKWKALGGEWKDSWKAKYGLPEKGLCDTLKENGVTIYTIAFGIKKDSLVRGKSLGVLKSCATNDQFYFELDETDKLGLTRAYDTIAQSLIKLRLIK